MYTPIQVANFFVKKRLDTGVDLTPMKLIKLCYIAHGWYCGFNNGDSLLSEPIYAWKYGPVIKSIYNEFNYYGSGQINAYANPDPNSSEIPFPGKDVEPLLEAIWNSYSIYDGIKLSAMTHQEGTPWYRVWNTENGKTKTNAIIPNDYITEYYKNMIEENRNAIVASPELV